MSKLGMGELVVILVIALIIFGPSKLPELATSMGEAIKEFRDAASGKGEPAEAKKEDKDE